MKTNLEDLAKKIFEVVENDLRDRRGIRHEWDRADEDLQQEIRDTNIKNIKEVLESNKN